MRRVTAYRANKILYNYICANQLQGNRVVLPTNICSDVVDTLRLIGMNLCFVDISQKSWCMNIEQTVQACRNAHVLLFVHSYGVENDMSPFFADINAMYPSLVIIEDKCLCTPLLQTKDNTFADLTLYSLGKKKQVDMGEGAIGFLKESWQYSEMDVADNDILLNREYQLNESDLLAKMQNVIAHKKKLNGIYSTHLPKKIQFSEPFQRWRFNIWVENKEQILSALFDNGLFASSHYKPQIEGCPVAQNLCDHVINLFNDQYYTEQKAVDTCKIINELIYSK